MTNPICIWIDHRKAVIAKLAPDGSRVTIVGSQVVAAVRTHFGKYGWPVAAHDSTMQQRPENRH